ncbi:hypothetical protein [Serratia silvae]|uniref:Type III secretion system protein n=1 Tax=Serratia silvae TaxID=2824122 RepID=A0ABT0KA05_9GAMM|nr:hypothetical protein [Serratia silvae]MCL1028786.1 hypothetical protein [Serratia silvae]
MSISNTSASLITTQYQSAISHAETMEPGALKKSDAVKPNSAVIIKDAESANTKALTGAGIREPKKNVDKDQLAQTTAQISQCLSQVTVAGDKTLTQHKADAPISSAANTTANAATRSSAAAQATLGPVAAEGSRGFNVGKLNEGYGSKFDEIGTLIRETLKKFGDAEVSQQNTATKLARESTEGGVDKLNDAAQKQYNSNVTSFTTNFSASLGGAGLASKSIHTNARSVKLNQTPGLMDKANAGRLMNEAKGSATLMKNAEPLLNRSSDLLQRHAKKVDQANYMSQGANALTSMSGSMGNMAGSSFVVGEAADRGEARLRDNDANTMSEMADAKRKNSEAIRELTQELLKLESESKARVDAGSFRV